MIHTRSAILEETHYYPWGLAIAPISSKAANAKVNNYLFTEKEFQSGEFSDNTGLENYDYGARNYEPQIGRWTSADPLDEYQYMTDAEDAETQDNLFNMEQHLFSSFESDKYKLSAENSAVQYDQSPYCFVRNNPIRYIDPFGLDTVPVFKPLPEATKAGTRKSGLLPWWGDALAFYTGGQLAYWGWPTIAKKMVTKGTATSVAASSGTSKASTWLTKKLDNTNFGKWFSDKAPRWFRKSPVGFPKPLGGNGVSWTITKTAGRWLGRWVPVVGWGLMAWEIWDNRKAIGEFADKAMKASAENIKHNREIDPSWSPRPCGGLL